MSDKYANEEDTKLLIKKVTEYLLRGIKGLQQMIKEEQKKLRVCSTCGNRFVITKIEEAEISKDKHQFIFVLQCEGCEMIVREGTHWYRNKIGEIKKLEDTE